MHGAHEMWHPDRRAVALDMQKTSDFDDVFNTIPIASLREVENVVLEPLCQGVGRSVWLYVFFRHRDYAADDNAYHSPVFVQDAMVTGVPGNGGSMSVP